MDVNMSLELLAGLPIKIQDNLFVYQFTIKEIISEIGMDVYNSYLSLLLIDSDYIEDILDNDEIEINPYEFVMINCLKNNEFQQIICEAYKLFLKQDMFFDEQCGLYCIVNNSPILIDLDIYQKTQYILRKVNCIPEPDKYDPGNEKAKEFIKRLKKNKRNAQKNTKSEFTLVDIISGIKWKSGESYKNVFGLTMYQLYDGLSRLQIIDDYDNTMLGIYTGNIDTKNNKIKLNWFKTIDKK